MQLSRRRWSSLIALVGIMALPAGLAHGTVIQESGKMPQGLARAAGDCDDLDPERCLLPFPNDFHTTSDGTTPTGRRVDLSTQAMPTNVLGKHIDTAEWNRN